MLMSNDHQIGKQAKTYTEHKTALLLEFSEISSKIIQYMGLTLLSIPSGIGFVVVVTVVERKREKLFPSPFT